MPLSMKQIVGLELKVIDMVDYSAFDDSVWCAHCRYRFSRDCDDGFPYPKHGCEDHALDVDTLSDKQKELLFLGALLGGDPDA